MMALCPSVHLSTTSGLGLLRSGEKSSVDRTGDFFNDVAAFVGLCTCCCCGLFRFDLDYFFKIFAAFSSFFALW